MYRWEWVTGDEQNDSSKIEQAYILKYAIEKKPSGKPISFGKISDLLKSHNIKISQDTVRRRVIDYQEKFGFLDQDRNLTPKGQEIVKVLDDLEVDEL